MEIQKQRVSIAWQIALDFVVLVYALTDNFPKEKVSEFSSQLKRQMKRTVVSIPSNITEWSRSSSLKERKRFLRIALEATFEIADQLKIVKRLAYAKKEDFEKVQQVMNEVSQMLSKMTREKY